MKAFDYDMDHDDHGYIESRARPWDNLMRSTASNQGRCQVLGRPADEDQRDTEQVRLPLKMISCCYRSIGRSMPPLCRAWS